MIAKESGLMSVPQELSAVAAAPLLCAGLTTFSALRNSPARPCDLVAVIGIGGLGHLAVQYARHFGYEVVAIDRGDERADLSQQLGAQHYINSAISDVAEALQALGGAALVLATASGGNTVERAIKGLRPGGTVITLGATDQPIAVRTEDLLFGTRAIAGSLTGTPAVGDAALRFSVITPVAAMIEIMTLEQAPEAYARMMEGMARFRIVLNIAATE